MSARRGAPIPPPTAGKCLVGVALPLLAGWIVAAARSRTDLFVGPFFWVFTYLLVMGAGLFACGAVSATRTRSMRRIRFGSPGTVVLEELAAGVASFLLFTAFVSR
jgi:hypothetical protein